VRVRVYKEAEGARKAVLEEDQVVVLHYLPPSGCCGYPGGLVFKAHRLLYFRLTDLLYIGPVSRVKKRKKKIICNQGLLVNKDTHRP